MQRQKDFVYTKGGNDPLHHSTTPHHPYSSIHRCYSQRRIKRYHFHAYLEKIRPAMSPCLAANQSRSPVLLGGSALEAQTPGFSDIGLFAISTASGHFILNENPPRWSRAFRPYSVCGLPLTPNFHQILTPIWVRILQKSFRGTLG